MTSTTRQTNLGSAPPMTRVEWAIARYNWYRACGLLNDSPQSPVNTTHERSPAPQATKPHLKWYPLSKPDDDLAMTYRPSAASIQRHRYSQRVDTVRHQAENGTQAQRDEPRTWSRVDWAIARYNWYRACGLLDDTPRQTTTYDRSADSPPPQPHLKWYPLNKPDGDPTAKNLRARDMLAHYQADKPSNGNRSGGPFDPSEHPRAERGQHNGGQFVKKAEEGVSTPGGGPRSRITTPGTTGANDSGPSLTPVKNPSQQTGSTKEVPDHLANGEVQRQEGQAFLSVPPEKLPAKRLPPEEIPGLLELFPLLPGETLEELLSMLGYSLADPQAYQSAWRAIVARKIGITSKQLTAYTDFQLHNQQVMKAIYSYYQSLYNGNPALLWAGMAKVAGNAVWDGLQLNLRSRNLPGAQLDRLSIFFERELVRMNREIFEDMGWTHEAYRTGGMREINSLYEMKAVSKDVRDAFGLIDDGIRTKNNALIETGNEKLLLREQSVILKRGYRELTERNMGKMMGSLGKCPIPGGRHFRESVNGGSLTKFEDRWEWIKKEMIWRWNTMSPAQRAALVNSPLGSSDSTPRQLVNLLSPSGATGYNPELGTMLRELNNRPPHRMTSKEYETLKKDFEKNK